MKNKNYCENCGAEISEDNDFCSNCYTKIDKVENSKLTKVTLIIKCIFNAIRYVLGVIIIAIGVEFLPNILRILLGISLLPITYRILFENFEKIRNGILPKILPIIFPVIIICLIVVPDDSVNNNNDKPLTYEEIVLDEIKKIDSAVHLVSCEHNEKNNKLNLKFQKKILDDDIYTCAVSSDNFISKLLGIAIISDVEFECLYAGKTSNYVRYDELYNIFDLEAKYFDADNNMLSTSFEELEKQHINDYKKSCKNYNYKDVLRTPNDYINKHAYWFGEIVQVVEKSENYSIFRVYVNCEKYYYIDGYSCSDAIYVVYRGSESFIEDDMIKMWGTLNGNVTYETKWGNYLTIPKFYAEYMELT